jgi:hypothetical protein
MLWWGSLKVSRPFLVLTLKEEERRGEERRRRRQRERERERGRERDYVYLPKHKRTLKLNDNGWEGVT